jgi:hypothetical protein
VGVPNYFAEQQLDVCLADPSENFSREVPVPSANGIRRTVSKRRTYHSMFRPGQDRHEFSINCTVKVRETTFDVFRLSKLARPAAVRKKPGGVRGHTASGIVGDLQDIWLCVRALRRREARDPKAARKAGIVPRVAHWAANMPRPSDRATTSIRHRRRPMRCSCIRQQPGWQFCTHFQSTQEMLSRAGSSKPSVATAPSQPVGRHCGQAALAGRRPLFSGETEFSPVSHHVRFFQRFQRKSDTWGLGSTVLAPFARDETFADALPAALQRLLACLLSGCRFHPSAFSSVIFHPSSFSTGRPWAIRMK